PCWQHLSLERAATQDIRTTSRWPRVIASCLRSVPWVRSGTDLEAAESAAGRGRQLLVDALDERSRRALPQRDAQLLQGVRSSLRDAADRAGGLVCDPADEVVAPRDIAHVHAESDALDPPVDDGLEARRGHAAQPSASASTTSSGLTLPSSRSPATSSRRSCDAANAAGSRAAAASRSSSRSS